jgi:hypothetical protein
VGSQHNDTNYVLHNVPVKNFVRRIWMKFMELEDLDHTSDERIMEQVVSG